MLFGEVANYDSILTSIQFNRLSGGWELTASFQAMDTQKMGGFLAN